MDPLRYERHLELLLAEGRRLAAMPAHALAAPVPAVPDWTLERVVRHTGKVHRWVAATLHAGPDADLDAVAASVEGLPTGPDCLAAYEAALHAVHDALAERSPDEPVASFVGPATAAFWCRRQAHEVAVHRIDAADAVHAAGGPEPEPLAVDGAADAVDEWARVFLATRWNQRFGPFPDDLAGRSLHLHGTDLPPPAGGAEWILAFGPDGLAVSAEHARADVALRAPVHGLLLALWRRRPLSSVEVLGDGELAARVHDLARF